MTDILKNLLKSLVINSSTLNYAALEHTAEQIAKVFGWSKEETAVEAVIKAAQAQDPKAILEAVSGLLTLIALRLPSHGLPKVAAAVSTGGIEVGYLYSAIDTAFDESTIAISRGVPAVEMLSPTTILEVVKLVDMLVTWIAALKAKQ